MLLFYILQKRPKSYIFFTDLLGHAPLQDPTLNDVSVASTSQIHASIMLLLLVLGYRKYEVAVASSGITFIPNFVKIDQSVQS
jgi:hypothetical protein